MKVVVFDIIFEDKRSKITYTFYMKQNGRHCPCTSTARDISYNSSIVQKACLVFSYISKMWRQIIVVFIPKYMLTELQ